MEERVLPWALGTVDLGSEVLEVGPGPGLMTELLRRRTPHLTSIEVDPQLARRLKDRWRADDVNVVEGDATAMDFADETFSSVVSFFMLHHVPSPELQNRLMSEAYRVLRPGGVFIGTDSVTSRLFALVHLFDTLVPVDPATLEKRLSQAGFSQISVDTKGRTMRFRAVRA